MQCRESDGFFEKVRFLWKDASRHTVSIMLVNVLQIYFYVTVEILSHQQSPGVVYRGFFVTKFKIREIDHIPGDYLVTLFTFGRFIRWGNPSCRRFLKNENSIIAIFKKSAWYYPCFNQIIPCSSIGTCEQRAKKWEIELRIATPLRESYILVHPTSSSL